MLNVGVLELFVSYDFSKSRSPFVFWANEDLHVALNACIVQAFRVVLGMSEADANYSPDKPKR